MTITDRDQYGREITKKAFSIECPGCKSDLDIDKDTSEIPLHARDGGVKVPAFKYGARFPAVAVKVVTVARRCKWSGAIILEPL